MVLVLPRYYTFERSDALRDSAMRPCYYYMAHVMDTCIMMMVNFHMLGSAMFTDFMCVSLPIFPYLSYLHFPIFPIFTSLIIRIDIHICLPILYLNDLDRCILYVYNIIYIYIFTRLPPSSPCKSHVHVSIFIWPLPNPIFL